MQNRFLIGLVSCWALVLASPLLAAVNASDRTSDHDAAIFREGTHVVRPGDTLQNITLRYLGSSERWQDNWRLNEDLLPDPHRLQPGQRLRVLIEELPVNGALLSVISNKVESRLLPLQWRNAEENELLQPDDNLRTAKQSSASLLFPDDTMLVITELSLVIIGRDAAPQDGVDKTLIEIEEGQADFTRTPGASGPLNLGIEVQIGDASMVPKANAAGALEARARKDGEGAQVMIYNGESQLSAGGSSVAVQQGMGSTVAGGGAAPSPPEKLLPAPSGLVPETGSEWAHLRPSFQWQPVAGAASYTVEVCQDPRCEALLQRATGVNAPSWAPDADLPLGGLHWRVSAVSPSGLDGFASDATGFQVVDKPSDAEAPTLAYGFEEPKANINEKVVVGPGFSLTIEPEDRDSGVASWYPVIDGEKKTAADLDGPWSYGDHEVVIVATDNAGNQLTSDPIQFAYDDQAPQLLWGLQSVPGAVSRDLVQQYSEDGPEATQRGRQTLEAGGRRWWMDSDFTQVILRPTSGKLRLDGATEKLSKKRGLWILAEDEICQIIDTVRYELEERFDSGRKGSPVLIVEAIDCVGNRSRIAFPLSRRGR